MQRGFDHPLFGKILNKFRECLEFAGYDLLFISHALIGEKKSYVEHCYHRNVDAVGIINPLSADNEIMELAESDIPCVSTNFIIPGVSTVVTANVDAGYKAASCFIKNGHKKIAYIGGTYSQYNMAAIDRLEGLKKAFKDFGLKYDESYVKFCHKWSRAESHDAMKELLERHSDITAVFVANDNMAVGAMEYVKSIGKRIPEDISFIGFDNEMISEFYSPSLTTFRQDIKTIGELSAEILMNRLVGIPVGECVRVPAEFIERNSVKKL